MKGPIYRRVLLLCSIGQLAIGLAAGASTPRPNGGGDLSGPWQLLVDDALIATKENVVRTYHPFSKHPGNPVMVADKPWEGKLAYLYGTVLPDDQTKGYRMWYHAWSGEYRNLYATSEDGINWSKPDLGLVDFEGSRANNIFLRRTKEDHLPQVIHTPWEKSVDRRYKLINYDYGRSGPDHSVSGFWAACSADGLHWQDVAQNPALKDPGDVGNFTWDSHKRRYVGYPKIFAPVRGYRRRCVGFTETTDFERWPPVQLILAPDEDDDRWTRGGNQHTDFYGLSAFAYESAYLGFLWLFRITDGQNDGPIYAELVSSRDGVRWTRQDPMRGGRVPILPVGPEGSWDRGMVFTPNHPLVEGDTVKLWYGGFDMTHGAPDDKARASIGLATLRKDGFASLDAGRPSGTITTKLLKGLQGALSVNVNARAGWLKVELLGANGEVVPGYSRDECVPVTTDAVDLRVRWRRHSELPGSNRARRLRFILQDAALFSFKPGAVVSVAEPEDPTLCHLTFDEALPMQARLVPKEESFRPPEEARDLSYLLLEPEPRPPKGPSPLLVYLYGAGGTLQDYNLMRAPYDRFRAALARQGYYVLVPDLGPLHWMNQRAQTVLTRILDYVAVHYPIDRARVEIMGTSMGGGSALAYAIQNPSRVRAVCCHMGMSDFAQWLQESPRFFETVTQAYGGSPEQVPEVFRRQSAMANLDAFSNVPVFLIAGGSDQTVPPGQCRRLADALSARGYYSAYCEAKGLGHEDRTITGFDDTLMEFLQMATGKATQFRAQNGVSVVHDAANASHGSGVACFPEGGVSVAGRLELLHTAHLGPQFSLAAMVKTPNQRTSRLFSNYRGSGDFVTGELVLDFDPSATTTPGVRFIANGQIVASGPLRLNPARYHQVTATYDLGRVILYLDGERVGTGGIKAGAAHLSHDRTVVRHFERAEAVTEVGIHLASNLFLGGDAGGRFVTYQDEVVAPSCGALSGFVDDVLVTRRVLNAAEVRRLARR